ncbi:MAG TPA: beta-ketoacyl-ACP synthase II [Polyangiaceae bacterium]|jgi:3-oxoacyl-[acyl-carrier-protein] synthase II|nr:MAG: 3-oxoacyl-(acyl-carrier-protein) synthase 2 [Deltaproteobacteria bacterium ADurb.Bin207]HNZ23266.1 beta-ketoacyl-ACP synthase II [Polyangiaceae bacterium]HOD23300.1 beta-ketoacyl-ACP synthase II [Polyangiaceae bacterium]HOE50609.1 beta-ketoacyl-ACP synthase II [Polyangiaceae bacterium]HOH00996.1 beta-ketoacyl-ACP synthase II [Polyangiaceae bacterium]
MDTARERIVVTGLGMVTPCGTGVTETWDNLLAGRSGIGLITAFDASEFAVRIAGEVKDWDPSVHIPKKKVRELGRFAQFAVASAQLAVRDAGLELTEQERENAACVMGVGMGGLEGLERVSEVIREKGPSKVSPYAVPTIAMNMAAGQISIALGIHGPSFCTASACASGAHAIGEALMLLRAGAASVAIAGGAEATITPTGIAGFQAMFALSRRNDDPKGACRPFDTQRDGFVASEGAAVLVLEPLTRAKRRGARIYAELTGYGSSCDAYHPVQPALDGRGAMASMRRAMQDAGLVAEQIEYINAHGTGTPQGDVQECKAIVDVFGHHASDQRLWVSSTKSMTGHLLGAAGAAEAAFTALACARGLVPPTINIGEKDPQCAVDVVANEARERSVRHALSNSFGFGGTNVSLVLSRVN